MHIKAQSVAVGLLLHIFTYICSLLCDLAYEQMSEGELVAKCMEKEDVAGLQHLREMGWDIYERDREFGDWLLFAIKHHNDKIADWLVLKYHEDGKQGFHALRFASEMIISDHYGIGFFEDRGSDYAMTLKRRWKPVLVKCLQGIDEDDLMQYIFFFMTQSCRWMMRAVIKAGVNLHWLDDENNTILHENFIAESYLILLEQGLDVNAMNDRGFTPLHSALLQNYGLGNSISRRNKIAMLLVFGADPNLNLNRPSFLPTYREFLQRVQMEVEDARERVHMKPLAFCMLTHRRLGNTNAHDLPRDILEKWLRPTNDSMQRLILKELGILPQ